MRTEFKADESDFIFDTVQKLQEHTSTGTTTTATATAVMTAGLITGAVNVKASSSFYKEEMVIGNGAYGTVYKAKDLTDPHSYVALKKVRIPLNEDGVPVSILREIGLVRQLDRFRHPNIVRFLDVCHGGGQIGGSSDNNSLVLFLVFEYVERDLAKYIQSHPLELTPAKIKDISYQILNGVEFLHSQRIIHRDLKPHNLLIRSDGRIKLADFGLAKIYDFTMRLTSVVVTLWYRSPELLLGSTYGTPVDLWSIGCIIAELFRRHPLFPGQSEHDQLEKIIDYFGTIDLDSEWKSDYRLMLDSFKPRPGRNLQFIVPGMCQLGYDLLTKLLVFNPNKRLSAREALNHEYFKGVEISSESNSSSNTSMEFTTTTTTTTVAASVVNANAISNLSAPTPTTSTQPSPSPSVGLTSTAPTTLPNTVTLTIGTNSSGSSNNSNSSL